MIMVDQVNTSSNGPVPRRDSVAGRIDTSLHFHDGAMRTVSRRYPASRGVFDGVLRALTDIRGHLRS